MGTMGTQFVYPLSRDLDITLQHGEKAEVIEKHLLACRDSCSFFVGADLARKLKSMLNPKDWADKTILAAGEMLFKERDKRLAFDLLWQASGVKPARRLKRQFAGWIDRGQ